MNLLILGGTTEASALARALAGDARFRATLSLAGRTQHPLPQSLPTRIGGFGGKSDVLARYQTFLGDASLYKVTLQRIAVSDGQLDRLVDVDSANEKLTFSKSPAVKSS